MPRSVRSPPSPLKPQAAVRFQLVAEAAAAQHSDSSSAESVESARILMVLSLSRTIAIGLRDVTVIVAPTGSWCLPYRRPRPASWYEMQARNAPVQGQAMTALSREADSGTLRGQAVRQGRKRGKRAKGAS